MRKFFYCMIFFFILGISTGYVFSEEKSDFDKAIQMFNEGWGGEALDKILEDLPYNGTRKPYKDRIQGIVQAPIKTSVKPPRAKAKEKPSISLSYKERDNSSDTEFLECYNDMFKVKFLCHKGWVIEEGDDESLFVIIQESPKLTFSIMKLTDGVKYIDQFNREHFEDIDLYQDGFQIESRDIAGKRAIKIKAFSKEYENMRLSDYYFVHNESLYGVFFSLSPKEEWSQYAKIVNRIVKSVKFIEDQ